MSINEAKKSARFPIFKDRFFQLRPKETSQDEFAKFLGISRQTVSFYENGERVPDALVLRQICEKCNVSSDWLLGLSEYRNTKSEQVLAKDLGLSEKAMYALLGLRNSPDHSELIDTVNLLLEQETCMPVDTYCIYGKLGADIFFLSPNEIIEKAEINIDGDARNLLCEIQETIDRWVSYSSAVRIISDIHNYLNINIPYGMLYVMESGKVVQVENLSGITTFPDSYLGGGFTIDIVKQIFLSNIRNDLDSMRQRHFDDPHLLI